MHPFAKGFLAGLLVGAAAGLLLSPQRGAENRALLRRRFQEALEAGRQAAQQQDEQLRLRFHQQIGRSVEEEPPSS